MAVMLRTLYPDVLQTNALPWLEEVIDQGRKTRPEEFRSIFKMQSTDKPFVQFTGIGALGTFLETDENADVTFQSVNQGFDKTSVWIN